MFLKFSYFPQFDLFLVNPKTISVEIAAEE
jgi:hypothetical protein